MHLLETNDHDAQCKQQRDAGTDLSSPGTGTCEQAQSTAGASPPEGVPEKFWDPENKTLRADALIKSYRELERKLGEHNPQGPPPPPKDYSIEVRNEILSVDAGVNARLNEAGFTNEQAQLVYDLAAEKLAPLVSEVASVFEAERQVERLVEHFGDQKHWREVSKQLGKWGRASLPAEVFDALSTTFEGIVAMHRMMKNSEPNLVCAGGTSEQVATEDALKRMMRDPRYWRDSDPDFVNQVRDGFRRLYPD